MNEQMKKELDHIHFRICGKGKNGKPKTVSDRERLRRALFIKEEYIDAGKHLWAIDHYIRAARHKVTRDNT